MQILFSVASITHEPSPNQRPVTPLHSHTQATISAPLSPVTNTLTKLDRFLKYAETNLGITNAQFHKTKLQEMGFGPDILHLVDDKALSNLGIKPGDVIRLKQNSLSWWNGEGGRQKRRKDTPPPTSQVLPSKKVHFEKRFHDGGTAHLYRPQIATGDLPPNLDFDWLYFCEAREAWVSLLPGYVPILESADDDLSFD